MASTKDEFANSLRNAHLPDDESVYVCAEIISPDGTEHTIKRTLTRDYGMRNNCESSLEIDGATVGPEKLSELGFSLSQPPLSAPVLAQHTLGYVFSLGPQNRTTYFKALLEVTDLDDLRGDIDDLRNELQFIESDSIIKFDRACSIEILDTILTDISNLVITNTQLNNAIMESAKLLIQTDRSDIPESLVDRQKIIREILDKLRKTAFPIDYFSRSTLAHWEPPTEQDFGKIDVFSETCKSINNTTAILTEVYTETLKLPSVANATDPIDCPVCETELSLTPRRIEDIRGHIEDSKEYSDQLNAARDILNDMSLKATALSNSIKNSLPRFAHGNQTQRLEVGFRIDRLRNLLSDQSELVDEWMSSLKTLLSFGRKIIKTADSLKIQLSQIAKNLPADLNQINLRETFSSLSRLRSDYIEANIAYDIPAQELERAVKEILDNLSSTNGWQDFLDCTSDCKRLLADLNERAANLTVLSELEQALLDFDSARAQVLDDKFSEYSQLAQVWWERLRPEESTFFNSVHPRPGARRTIDLKAGLASSVDRSETKLRDVIAIFSQSQLHCLGLALFLAKAEHEGFGFIVLDDPVLSSDEDYKVNFNSTVLEELLKTQMQIVVIIQDHGSWKELENRYRHIGLSKAQLYIDSPIEGTIIENTSDELLSLISRAKSLSRAGHPVAQKECGRILRDAGEKFCKEMLVLNDSQNGNSNAKLSDYDGNTLEWLIPRVEPLLIKDPSHPGKLYVFKSFVNDASHDNSPPGSAVMRGACGDIQRLVKDYLNR